MRMSDLVYHEDLGFRCWLMGNDGRLALIMMY
jgi:hypothetical protein